MTCPFRRQILPSEDEFRDVICAHTRLIFDSDPKWEDDFLDFTLDDGRRFRVSPAPIWQFECLEAKPDSNDEIRHKAKRVAPVGNWFLTSRELPDHFRGEGLLIPPVFEAVVRGRQEIVATHGSGAYVDWLALTEDAKLAGRCMNWFREHDHDSIEAVCAFTEHFTSASLAKIFSWRFPDSHLPLALCLRSRGFDRLLDAYPQLALLVARTLWDRGVLHLGSPAKLCAILKMGPMALLRVAGFPAEKRLLQLLRRVHINDVKDRYLSALITVASDPALTDRLLALEPPVYAEDLLLQATSLPPNHSLAIGIHNLLLEQRARPGYAPPHAEGSTLVHAYLGLIDDLTRQQKNSVSRIRSPERLRRTLLSIAEARASDWEGDWSTKLEPPIPGSGAVSFLATPAEIIAAALQFHNCASQRVAKAVAGEIALYVVRAKGHSGMLQLQKTVAGEWKPRVLLGPCNRAPHPRVRMMLHRWFSRSRAVKDSA